MAFYQGDDTLDDIMYEIINNSFSEKYIKSIADCCKVAPISLHGYHQEDAGNGTSAHMDYFTCAESEGSTPINDMLPNVIENNYPLDYQENYTENRSGRTVDNVELKHVMNTPSRSMENSTWKPLPMNLQPCAVYSTQSVKDYCLLNNGVRRKHENATKVRGHLLALGWKIEHSLYRGCDRFRYTSPNREVYYSLQKICEQLVKQGTQNCSNSIARGSQVVQAQIPLEGGTGENGGAETGCGDSGQLINVVVENGYTTQTVMDVDSHRPVLRKRKFESNDLDADVKKVNLEGPFQQAGSMWGSFMNPTSVRKPSHGQKPNCADGYPMNTRSKRTAPTSLSYLIDNFMISMGDKARYYNRKDNSVMKEGSITREGILCSCCGDVYSISKFEAHAGSSNHRPAANIVLENGRSLLELQTVVKQVTGKKGPEQYPNKQMGSDLPQFQFQQLMDNKKDEGSTGFLHKHMCNNLSHQVIQPVEGFNEVNGFTGHLLLKGSQTLVGGNDFTGNPSQNVELCLPQLEAQQRKDDNIVNAFTEHPNEESENNGGFNKDNGMCYICRRDGNELIVCKGGCLSMFHFSCIGLKAFPEKEWYCPSCLCELCGGGEFDESEQFVEKTMLCCDQCEHGYHVGCLRKRGDTGLDHCPEGNWFCGEKCSRIFFHLQQLLGKSNPAGVDGLSWTILKSNKNDGNDLRRSQADIKNESKLLDARAVLRKCFKRIIQPGSKTDLVTDVVFSKESSYPCQNYRGFYTMILDKGKKPISVATFRIHGHKVAELPLVGTRILRRRRGFCRLLMNNLQKLLLDIGVERLLLPATPKLLQTWLNSFGFVEMSNSERLELLGYPILEFTDTTLCQKLLTASPTQAAKLGGSKKNDVQSNVEEGHHLQKSASEVTQEVVPVKTISPIIWLNYFGTEAANGTKKAKHPSLRNTYCSSSRMLIQEAKPIRQTCTG